MKTKQQKEALATGIVFLVLAVLLLFALFQGGCKDNQTIGEFFGLDHGRSIPEEKPADTLGIIITEWKKAKAALIEAAIHKLSIEYSKALYATDSVYMILVYAYKLKHAIRGNGAASWKEVIP